MPPKLIALLIVMTFSAVLVGLGGWGLWITLQEIRKPAPPAPFTVVYSGSRYSYVGFDGNVVPDDFTTHDEAESAAFAAKTWHVHYEQTLKAQRATDDAAKIARQKWRNATFRASGKVAP